jgi:hypothetical protein
MRCVGLHGRALVLHFCPFWRFLRGGLFLCVCLFLVPFASLRLQKMDFIARRSKEDIQTIDFAEFR